VSPENPEEEIYEKAKKRVSDKKDFYTHVAVYIVINIILVIIWAASGVDYPWFIWPLGGWGIGLSFHFLNVFVFQGDSDWEKREIEKEAEKLRRKEGK